MHELDPASVEMLRFDGFEVPSVNLNDLEIVPRHLGLSGRVFEYVKSYPHRGYAAIAPRDIDSLLTAGKDLLMVERGERYYLYQG